MGDEDNRAGTAPGHSRHGQINDPTRPMTPEQAGALRQDAPLVLPGQDQGVLPLSAYTEDTQAFRTPVAAPPPPHVSQHLPVPVAAPMPALTRKLPLTSVQPLRTVSSTPPRPVKPVRNLWLFWCAAGLICLVLVGMAFAVFSSLSATSQHLAQEQTLSPTPDKQTPIVNTPAQTGAFTLMPDHFTSASCEVDNGYRCTALLSYAPLSQETVNWTAYGTGVATKFSPASGTIAPGQQVQVIIYMLTPCPNHGTFVFLLDNASKRLEVPWSCAGVDG